MMMTFILAIAATILAIAISDFEVTESYIVDFILVPPVAVLFVVFAMETLREALLIRSKAIKLEKMEVVSQLAASISHEIRNPLTVVKGFMQLMRGKDISEETKEQYMNIALEELDRACAIIDDYLTFAKPFPEKQNRFMYIMNYKSDRHVASVREHSWGENRPNTYACNNQRERTIFSAMLLNIIKMELKR